MRLKILFVPAVFLVAIIISISYVWPSVQDAISKRKDLKKSQESFNTIMQKKENASSLGNSLDKNKDKEDFLLNFLPQSGNEEKIIDGVNYLSIDSGVSLINVAIIKEKIEKANQNNEEEQTLRSNSAAGNQEKTSSITKNPKISFLDTKITISGKYDNIKTFLGQLYKMEMLNNVSSLEIKKPEASNEEEKVEPDVLIASIVAKFGYLNPVKAEKVGELAIFSQNSFDFKPYSNFYDLIVRKIPVLDGGEKGKANPFIP